MINEALIWDKFYGRIIPSEYWNYKLQEQWAKQATEFYLAFNKLSVIDIDKLAQPYVFTKKIVANALEDFLGFHVRDFELSPNYNGGMLAIYMGTDNSLILTVELTEDYDMIVNYINGGISGKLRYSYELDSEFKKKELERLFTRLFYEWF